MFSTDKHLIGPAKSRSIGGKKNLDGKSNTTGGIAREVCDISAASRTTWKGLPPSTGRGTCATTEDMNCSRGH